MVQSYMCLKLVIGENSHNQFLWYMLTSIKLWIFRWHHLNLISYWLFPKMQQWVIKYPVVRAVPSFNFNDTIQLGEFSIINDNLITLASRNYLKIFDITHGKLKANLLMSKAKIQHFCYDNDENMVVINADEKIGLLDTRDGQLNNIAEGHNSFRDVKLVLLKDNYNIVSSGFDKDNCREIMLRDTRNFDKIIVKASFRVENGILIPVYHKTKNILFIASNLQ